jgi:hypothetical protein
MGHVRLGTLSQTKRWREVVGLLKSEASLQDVAAAAAEASEADLKRASDDPLFQYVAGLLVHLPLAARAPDFEGGLERLGIDGNKGVSVSALLSGIDEAIERQAFEGGRTSDAGELARSALMESLSVNLRGRLPTLFEPTPQEVRKVLAGFAGGDRFARLARDFFARLSYRSLDWYLSRELANHTGPGRRFDTDADRTAFQRALAQHTYEASRIVETYAGGWYGKTVWRDQSLTQGAINDFTRYAFKKMRVELGRRREPV